MSTVVHVGEKRGTVLDVVLGDSVPVASCRAADGLKNDGVKCDRGLLCCNENTHQINHRVLKNYSKKT